MSKRRRYSREYLEAFLQQVKATMPGWIFSQVHRNASRQAGGRARWRSHEEALELLKREAETDSFKLQSLIFPKEHWSRDEAVDWATSHDYSADKVDETEQSYRIRQREPAGFERLRTICLMPGEGDEGCMLSAVGGPLKKSQESAMEKEEGEERDAPSLTERQVRGFLWKTVLSALEDLFPGYDAKIEKAMMIGAEHDGILEGIWPAIFPSHDMGDIVGAFLPSTDSAAIKEALPDGVAEGVDGFISAIRNVSAAGHSPLLADVLTSEGAVNVGSLALRGIVRKFLPTGRTGGGSSCVSSPSWMSPPIFTKTVNVAADGSLKLVLPTPDDFLPAFEAYLGIGGHETMLEIDPATVKDSLSKALWSQAYINNLSDDAFAHISPGGKKDSEGKTTPRSLRHLPYRDASGKPDAAHVRNALARLNQTQIPASAKASAKRKLLAAARALGIQTAEEKQVPIFAASDKQVVYGVVMEPDVTDSQGDRTTAETIERAAHAFMVRSRIVGDSHKAKAAAYPVESYIAPSDIEVAGQKVKAGSWIMGIYVADQKLWQAIKNGEYTGLSIGGRAIRRPNLPEE
jgi:hypothetical protein